MQFKKFLCALDASITQSFSITIATQLYLSEVHAQRHIDSWYVNMAFLSTDLQQIEPKICTRQWSFEMSRWKFFLGFWLAIANSHSLAWLKKTTKKSQLDFRKCSINWHVSHWPRFRGKVLEHVLTSSTPLKHHLLNLVLFTLAELVEMTNLSLTFTVIIIYFQILHLRCECLEVEFFFRHQHVPISYLYPKCLPACLAQIKTSAYRHVWICRLCRMTLPCIKK